MTTTNEHTERADLKPCPFCGHTGLDFSEGSTFRWIVASCSECGASRGETRIQTLGEGTKDEWMAEAQADAIRKWNQRAAMLEAQPAREWVGLTPEDVTMAVSNVTLERKEDGTDPSFASALAAELDAKLREKNAGQPAAMKPWQIMPTVKDRATNRELPVVGVYEDVVFVDVPAPEKAVSAWRDHGANTGMRHPEESDLYDGSEHAQPALEWVEPTDEQFHEAWNEHAAKIDREFNTSSNQNFFAAGWLAHGTKLREKNAGLPAAVSDDIPAILKKQAS